MPWWIYAVFVVLVTVLIVFDLTVLHRHSKTISMRKALTWTGVWITVALIFSGFVFLLYDGRILADQIEKPVLTGKEAWLQYLTGYIVEYSLSMDNVFVIAMIISAFRVPSEHQHRLLFWGVLGAAALRGLMIWGGAMLMARFDWTIYAFGLLLIFSAIKMALSPPEEIDPEASFLVRLVRRFFPVTSRFDGGRFFTMENGVRTATPMLLALVLIESCDVVFAVDSIPAVFAVTRDPFLVFSSNIFAILGLRSLYFALAGLMNLFHYLKYSMIALLFYVGVKMLLSHHYKIPNLVSLGIIASFLAAGIIASLLAARAKTTHTPPAPALEPQREER